MSKNKTQIVPGKITFRYSSDGYTDPERTADSTFRIPFPELAKVVANDRFKIDGEAILLVKDGVVVGAAFREEDLKDGMVLDMRK